MKKKVISILTGILAVGLLAGCGQSKTDNPLRNTDVDKYLTLTDYQNLSVTVEPVTVEQEERDYSVMESYSGFATAENSGVTDRAVVNGDTVNIDYVGKKDDVAFDGGTATGAFLVIGSGSYIDGFEDGLVGVKPGETVELELSFPEDYDNTELAGQAVVFSVTVNYIVELRDAVVATMGIEGVGTVEELQQHVYDELYASREAEYTKKVKNAIMGVLLEQCTYTELPEAVLESNKEYVRGIVNAAASYGLDADTYTNYFFGMNAEDYINSYAEQLTKQDIILQAIANREGLNVKDKELRDTLKEYAENAGFDTVEEYLGDASEEEYRNYFMNEKVMDFLLEKTQVNN